MTLADAAARVVALARAIRTYYDRELPRYYRDYPLIHDGERPPPVPSEEFELEGYLRSLPEGIPVALLTIMLIGRQSVRIEDLTDEYDVSKTIADPTRYAIALMMRTFPLGEQLQEGLDRLQQHGIDPESLLLEPSREA